MGIEVNIVDPITRFEQAKDMLAANMRESNSPVELNAEDTFEFYTKLNDAGILYGIEAVDDGKLIGYCCATITPHPLNASEIVCDANGLYIVSDHRGGGTFNAIITKLEEIARTHRATLLHFHAPAGSDFDKVLALRFTPLSNYYYKELKYDGLAALEGKQVAIARSSDEAIAKVRNAENLAREMPQVPIETTHVIHAGVYARTIMLKEGVMITGALIKKATTLIITGNVAATIGEETIGLVGYNVIPASAHRKQAYLAIEDSYITMIFATNATSVEEAENEFTDEAELLSSRDPSAINHTIITTGE